jgi:hypothetical protein
MPVPLAAFAAISVGTKLGEALLSGWSAEKRRKRMRAAIKPLQDRMRQYAVAPSESEGDLLTMLTTARLNELAQRGVLQSSTSPGRVGQAIAPVLNAREQRLDEMATRIAAMNQAAEGEGGGYTDAFAGLMGDVGETAAMMGAEQYFTPKATGTMSATAATGAPENLGLRKLDPQGALEASQVEMLRQRRRRRSGTGNMVGSW